VSCLRARFKLGFRTSLSLFFLFSEKKKEKEEIWRQRGGDGEMRKRPRMCKYFILFYFIFEFI
jgi:hypothetical protein